MDRPSRWVNLTASGLAFYVLACVYYDGASSITPKFLANWLTWLMATPEAFRATILILIAIIGLANLWQFFWKGRDS